MWINAEGEKKKNKLKNLQVVSVEQDGRKFTIPFTLEDLVISSVKISFPAEPSFFLGTTIFVEYFQLHSLELP